MVFKAKPYMAFKANHMVQPYEFQGQAIYDFQGQPRAQTYLVFKVKPYMVLKVNHGSKSCNWLTIWLNHIWLDFWKPCGSTITFSRSNHMTFEVKYVVQQCSFQGQTIYCFQGQPWAQVVPFYWYIKNKKYTIMEGKLVRNSVLIQYKQARCTFLI